MYPEIMRKGPGYLNVIHVKIDSVTTTLNDIPDLKGRVALVTCGNAGLGYTTVLELVRQGAKVYMAPRTSFAVDAAIAFSKAAVPATPVGFLAFDFTSPSAAKATAEKLLERDALGYTGFQRGGVPVRELEVERTHASYPWFARFSFLEKYVLLSPEQGARRQPYAATALELEERAGERRTSCHTSISTQSHSLPHSRIKGVNAPSQELERESLYAKLEGWHEDALILDSKKRSPSSPTADGTRTSSTVGHLRKPVGAVVFISAEEDPFLRAAEQLRVDSTRSMLRRLHVSPWISGARCMQVATSIRRQKFVFECGGGKPYGDKTLKTQLRDSLNHQQLPDVFTTVGLSRDIILTWLLEHYPDLVGYDVQDTPHAHTTVALSGDVSVKHYGIEGRPSAAHIIDEGVEGRHTPASVFIRTMCSWRSDTRRRSDARSLKRCGLRGSRAGI
ncbi:hypothetical protein DFH08DRAFT_936037 [Mycena albidolilacea]|uniref:Oxidoreductase n=1 Tax=Mycena albidolilacea TaxID=1033008 RepID=A0AAD7A3W7_9AGAR|nr:hypothetical protein DFH08DRAFT_936037 [Mycena albidolilacea]